MPSIRLGDPWDGAALGYDEWKTRLPDWWERDDEPNGYDRFYCDACRDIGWLLCEDVNLDHPIVIPCTECSAEVELSDLEE